MASRKLQFLCLSAAALLLAGCAGGMPGKATATSGGRSTPKADSQKLASAIASAAQDAAAGGMTQESLMFQEKLYRQDPRNPDNIINYARGLRRAGKLEDAKLVIRTPAKAKRVTAPMLTEAAMVFVSAGEYEEALDFAQKSLEKDGKSPDAHHALALALSGLDKNADAQLQFQKALELWPDTRDTTPVINNLAMSLAAQGKVKEAKNVMALATGEALRSPVYLNNRAMLNTLKDREIAAEKIAPPAETVKQVTSVSPNREKTKPARKMPGRMKPIVE